MTKKTVLYILIACVVVLLVIGGVLGAIFLPFRGITGDTDYAAAKADILSLFEKRQADLQAAADTVLQTGSTEGVSVRGVNSISLSSGGTVDFSVDAQGMLGGQYWGLYYAPEDKPVCFYGGPLTPGPHADTYFWKPTDPADNDFYATEKIAGGWYVYYMDYDGSRHGLNWG